MITINKIGNTANTRICEIVCLSTDTKPVEVCDGVNLCNGSTCLEMDTGKCFIYDEENKKWYEL